AHGGLGDDRRPHRAFAARVLPAPRRLRCAYRVPGGPQPRRPQLLQPARGCDPARRADLQHGGFLPGGGGGLGAPALHAGGATAGGAARLEPSAAGAARAPAAAAAAVSREAAAVRVSPGAAVRLRGAPGRTAVAAGVVSGGGPPARRRKPAS